MIAMMTLIVIGFILLFAGINKIWSRFAVIANNAAIYDEVNEVNDPNDPNNLIVFRVASGY